jgi:hypothetical protein
MPYHLNIFQCKKNDKQNSQKIKKIFIYYFSCGSVYVNEVLTSPKFNYEEKTAFMKGKNEWNSFLKH